MTYYCHTRKGGTTGHEFTEQHAKEIGVHFKDFKRINAFELINRWNRQACIACEGRPRYLYYI